MKKLRLINRKIRRKKENPKIVKIEKVDAVHCRVSSGDRLKLLNCLGFSDTVWLPSEYGRRPVERKKFFIDRNGYFLTGLLERVSDYLTKKGLEVQFVGRYRRLQSHKPMLKGVKLWPLQAKAIEKARKVQRGVIHFPTGTGKTVIAGGVISCFLPKKKVLFLCHTIDILNQTYSRFMEYGFESLTILGGRWKDREAFLKGKVCLSTIQSFSSLNPKDYVGEFDVVLVDEVHHISSMGTQYAKALEQMLAPVRIGLTATVPEKRESLFAMEGLMGPVIAKLTSEQGEQLKLLAKVKLNLISVPSSTGIKNAVGYRPMYKEGIVNNRTRNRLIAEQVLRSLNDRETSLILIKDLEHGEKIKRVCKIYGIDAVFIHGKDDAETRKMVAGEFNKKKIKCVIASVIWKEGIDIPSLNHIVNAFGGKGAIPTVQVAGRGTRTDEGKKLSVRVTDFLDPYRYLAEHTVRRLQIYKERGWL